MAAYTTVHTDWGFTGIVCSDRGLSGLLLPEPTEAAVRRWIESVWPDAVFNASLAPRLQGQIRAYFSGQRVAFDCPVDLSRMTSFQHAALAACRRIKYGEIATYGDLAQAVGSPHAARAVGGAMARNPVPLVVPCHRIIAGNGSLCGFSARRGISLKQRMLDLESAGARTVSERVA